MSGVLNALVGVGSKSAYVVNVASVLSGGAFGFNGDASLGSTGGTASPSAFLGQTLAFVISASGVQFRVDMGTGGLTQNFFKSVTVQDGTGAFITLNTADASSFTATTPQNHSAWLWTGSALWTSAHGNRSVLINF